MGRTLFFCFTGKRFVKVDPGGRDDWHTGPSRNPLDTSFMVASKRSWSSSGSPELCKDSIMTDLLISDTFLRSSQVILAGLNFWEKTPERGKDPVRSNPLVRSSTNVWSSCPESAMSLSRSFNRLSFNTSAILWLRASFDSFSSLSVLMAKAVHFLICSVRSMAIWWTVQVDRWVTFSLTSLGKSDCCSVGCLSLNASCTNSSGEKWIPTVTWSLAALATYPRLGVLSFRECGGKEAVSAWVVICWNLISKFCKREVELPIYEVCIYKPHILQFALTQIHLSILTILF